jgi:peptidoglycan hydrolase-like protein with peptidoglycan-binding domain
MNPMPRCLLAVGFLAALGTPSLEAKDDATDSNGCLKIPASVRIGAVGDRVREIQATLNEELAGRLIPLPAGSMVGPAILKDGSPYSPDNPEHSAIDLREHVRQLKLADGRDLRVRGNWRPFKCETTPDGEPAPPRELVPSGLESADCLQLPPHRPLLVDGVYGQHTYSGVLMFQCLKNLQPSGEVDAVTLDKLEPMVPPNRLLAGVMRWVGEHGLIGSKFDETSDAFPWWIKVWTSFVTTVFLLLLSLPVYWLARKLASAPEILSNWLFAPPTSPVFRALIRKEAFIRMAQFGPALFICFAARIVFPEPQQSEGDPFRCEDRLPGAPAERGGPVSLSRRVPEVACLPDPIQPRLHGFRRRPDHPGVHQLVRRDLCRRR